MNLTHQKAGLAGEKNTVEHFEKYESYTWRLACPVLNPPKHFRVISVDKVRKEITIAAIEREKRIYGKFES